MLRQVSHTATTKIFAVKSTPRNYRHLCYSQYGSAIQAAAAGGHESIVLLLLKHGADVKAPGGYYGSAIAAATAVVTSLSFSYS